MAKPSDEVKIMAGMSQVLLRVNLEHLAKLLCISDSPNNIVTPRHGYPPMPRILSGLGSQERPNLNSLKDLLQVCTFPDSGISLRCCLWWRCGGDTRDLDLSMTPNPNKLL
jgi:hypothetical protein